MAVHPAIHLPITQKEKEKLLHLLYARPVASCGCKLREALRNILVLKQLQGKDELRDTSKDS